jgi:hypothetical protein
MSLNSRVGFSDAWDIAHKDRQPLIAMVEPMEVSAVGQKGAGRVENGLL